MNEVQIFDSIEFGKIRTVVIDDEPWFIAKDISESLGYSQTANMLKIVDLEDKKKVASSDLDGTFSKYSVGITVINESGLYASIFGSKLESARKFKRWVTKEVLPSIRKTGAYNTNQLPQTPMQLLELHYEALKQVDKKVDEVSDEVKELRDDIEAVKMDLPILPIEADKITVAVKKKGVEVLGGKSSSAYNDRSLRQKLYNDLYSNLKYNFGVKSYKSIKRSQCDEAIKIIGQYMPPYFLAAMIDDANQQQILNFN